MIERDESTGGEPGAEETPSAEEGSTSPSTEGNAASAPPPGVSDDPRPADGEPSHHDDKVVEAPTIETQPTEQERLREQLEEASARLRTVSKAYTDLQKEMDAFRKRQQVLAESKAEKKAAQVVERFFEPVQNLKRALEDTTSDADGLRNGVRMVLQQFSRQMEELGLREVPGVGATFDPKVHDALAVMPVTDPDQDGKVVTVHNTGWTVGERVIQPAQVVIGKYQEPAEA
jgi:molecular chaperone GrpE